MTRNAEIRRRSFEATATVMGMLLAVVLFVAVFASPARADTFTVNSLDDPGTGGCDATECTLREAIEAANTNNQVDTIKFSVTGEITLAGGSSPTSGRLTILSDSGNGLTIDGPGPSELSVNGDNAT